MSNKGWGYTVSGRLSGTIKPVNNDVPIAGDDEVVIKLKAMALNPVDEQLWGSRLRTASQIGHTDVVKQGSARTQLHEEDGDRSAK
jgi:NADPH:quinone reductase-like Zn-dependent oxidoreductase